MERRNNSNNIVTVFYYDYWLLFATCVLLAFGLLMVGSASMAISDLQYNAPFHFLGRQFVYVGIGISLAIFMLQIPLIFWERIGGSLLLGSVILLVLVLVPFIGHEVNGSVRWLGIGPVMFQVSELVKGCMVMYMAGYLVRREDELRSNVKGFLKPLLVLALISLLLLLEPDFGGTCVIVVTVLGMLFLGGARLWQFVLLLSMALVSLGALAISSPYRLARLAAFLDPWATPFGSGYQLTQSLIAFGRGGFLGVGLGNSVQKLFYLPEAHTDFLFAVLAEEFGFLGELLVLSLFMFVVGRAFWLGLHAKRLGNIFAANLAYGLGLLLAIQVSVNIGVNMGILPTKGLTLPFMSYGGSSMVFNCAIMAVLLRINHELKIIR